MPRSIQGETKRRNSFTHLRSLDDTTISYRSTPDYLRQLVSTSSTPRTVRSRRSSATESSTVNGNPKYKAQEDYYDEVHSLKKELKSFQLENGHLRAKIRRLEEDNGRKRKELDDFYHSHKEDKGRRSSVTSLPDRSSSTLNLKQKLFRLELQLKQKETIIDEMKRDPRWSRGTELEIQTRALLQEVERQKLVHLTEIRDDYKASFEEEQKNAVRKLHAEKSALILENEALKKKLDEEPMTAQREKDLQEKIHRLKEESRFYQDELEQKKADWKQMRRERDRWIDKFDRLKERRDAYRHNDDDVTEFRRNHAAKVIQRQWRSYREHSPKKQSYVSRSSHQGNLTRDNALKIVQAALRGYLQRDVSHRSSSTVNGNHRTGSTRLNQSTNDWKSSRNSWTKSKTSGRLSTVLDDETFFS